MENENRTIEEAVCKQIQFLRGCFEEYRLDAQDYINAKNGFEMDDSTAGSHLINDCATNAGGVLIKLTNDIARKAYVKEFSVAKQQLLNRAKENRDVSAKKIDVEISVLSALKQLANDEHFDQTILCKYDI